MQDRKDAELRDGGQNGCWTVDMRDAGQKRCRIEEMQDRRDAEIKEVSTKSYSNNVINPPITERYIHSTGNRLGLNSIQFSLTFFSL